MGASEERRFRRGVVAAIRDVIDQHALAAVPRRHYAREDEFLAAIRRPATGQAHTCTGERGMAPLEGVKMRDVADAVSTVLFRLGIYCDREAVAQNVCVPRTYALFEENDLYGVRLSRTEARVLRDSLSIAVDPGLRKKLERT